MDKNNYAFNAKIVTLILSVIVAVTLLSLECYIELISIIAGEIVLWVVLTIQDIKINLLQSINTKLEQGDNRNS